MQKKLKSGTSVTLLSVGTGGIHNNRRPRVDENPKDYANRSAIQWHRVSVYPQKLGDLVTKHVVPGSAHSLIHSPLFQLTNCRIAPY